MEEGTHTACICTGYGIGGAYAAPRLRRAVSGASVHMTLNFWGARYTEVRVIHRKIRYMCICCKVDCVDITVLHLPVLLCNMVCVVFVV